MTYCINCGSRIEENASYCPKCGLNVQEHKTGEKLESDGLKCPRCGSGTVLRTATKGPNAGRKFYVCERYPECKGRISIGQSKKSPAKMLAILSIVVVAIVAAVVVSLLMMGNESGTNQNVIGTYKNPTDQNEVMEIKADGTYDGLSFYGYYVTGTWRIDGNTIWFTQTGDEYPYILEIEGNYLIDYTGAVQWVKQ